MGILHSTINDSVSTFTGVPISSGYVGNDGESLFCYGFSSTLNLSSSPEDTELFLAKLE
jgi:hypothetical protein